MKRALLNTLLIAVLLAMTVTVTAGSPNQSIGINVLLNTEATEAILADLGNHGRVLNVLYEINALTMKAKASELGAIQALPYVEAVNPDAKRSFGPPWDTVEVDNFADGLGTWDLDAINVTDYQYGRVVEQDGAGVYVAVLDTGLVKIWRQYFPEERIAEEYGRAFGGGGGEQGWVSEQPNKWERDTHSHGTHVSSTILGYNWFGGPTYMSGVAPMATVIPVKVLNQNGSGWSSVIARGITYVADLKAGPLADHPVVINMSLGGPELDAMEQAAIDYAIERGVIIVASAGNEGEKGMGYPGAYEPVISVASSGWIHEWELIDGCPFNWWLCDVADPISTADFYISDFSSRELPDQDLDVAAPGSWVVGPYSPDQMGKVSYYYVGGTSMASPHVAGIVALMTQKYPALTAGEAEAILESTATALDPGCRLVEGEEVCWGADATGAGLTTADAALAATP
jgi:subtilisin family serine protease